MHDTKIGNVKDNTMNNIFLFNLIVLQHRHSRLVELKKEENFSFTQLFNPVLQVHRIIPTACCGLFTLSHLQVLQTRTQGIFIFYIYWMWKIEISVKVWDLNLQHTQYSQNKMLFIHSCGQDLKLAKHEQADAHCLYNSVYLLHSFVSWTFVQTA
jgi:hypothetical protein